MELANFRLMDHLNVVSVLQILFAQMTIAATNVKNVIRNLVVSLALPDQVSVILIQIFVIQVFTRILMVLALLCVRPVPIVKEIGITVKVVL